MACWTIQSESKKSLALFRQKVLETKEARGDKVGRTYTQIIIHYNTDSLSIIFIDLISSEVQVDTDGWSWCNPIYKKYENFQQVLSNKG